MATITKKTGFTVLVAGLALTISILGIGSSPAFGCWEGFGCGYDYANGWMTGGGSIFYPDGEEIAKYGGQIGSNGRVTHGFVVHCNPRHSDNLEIVDHATGLNFHLQNLSRAVCTDDPDIVPNPPDAAFDTFEGWGEGRCKSISERWEPCSIHFVFTDGGERGGCLRDTARIEIEDSDGPLLTIYNDVDCGNNQAHDGF